MTDRPRVACFRPDDERTERAVDLLAGLDVTPRPDPLLRVEATGVDPRTDAAYLVLTSRTSADLVSAETINAADTTVCAIGPSTANALADAGVSVDVIPAEYTSSGLVARLADEIDGATVEIARSDHGSDTLPVGLQAAGAYVHESILYRLVRPPASGESTVELVDDDLDALLFTSSLTVEHFLAAAAERGLQDRVLDACTDVVVGVIGDPTCRTAEEAGLPVDVVASEADFETLARETVSVLGGSGGS